MELRPFLLEQWLEELESTCQFDLASSYGPHWKVKELLDFMSPEEREAFLNGHVTYSPSRGGESLREEIADWYGVRPEEIQIVTGASEALLCLFFLAAEPGANVVVPTPGFPTFGAIPESMGLELRNYRLREENAYEVDIDEIKKSVDAKTKLLLVNTPHNPTGMIASSQRLRELHDFCADRGIQFVVDEVYHPVSYGEPIESAATLPRVTVLGDFSKALCLSGLRLGWIVEKDRKKLEQYWNARSYFTISNTSVSEALGLAAARRRDQIFDRALAVARPNLKFADAFFAEQAGRLSWVRPRGGFVSFPRVLFSDDSRELCRKAGERGVRLAPGYCFEAPAHFRLGFGACENGFSRALEIVSEVVSELLPESKAV